MCLTDDELKPLIRHLIRLGMQRGLTFHDAEDRAQETFVRVWRTLDEDGKTNRGQYPPRSYYRIVLARQTIDLWRKQYGDRRGGRHVVYDSQVTDVATTKERFEYVDEEVLEFLSFLDDIDEVELAEVIRDIIQRGCSLAHACHRVGMSIQELEKRARVARRKWRHSVERYS